MKKYWILITCLGLLFIGGLLNGTMDKLQFHYGKSIFPQEEGETLLGQDYLFWNPKHSWKNKYEDWPEDKSPAFIGSTTFLVALTDAWHLIKMLMKLCYHFAIVLPLVYLYRFPRWVLFAALIPIHALVGVAFTIAFSWLLVKRESQAA